MKDPKAEQTVYRRVIAGVSWPTASRPGWIILLGESLFPDFSIVGSPHTYHEIASCSNSSLDYLCRTAGKLYTKYPEAEFFGDTINPMNAVWISLGAPALYKAQFCDNPEDLHFYGHLIRKLLSAPKTLFFAPESGIDGKLLVGMRQEDISSGRAAEHPLLAAIGHAAIELELYRPVVSKAPRLFEPFHHTNGWMSR